MQNVPVAAPAGTYDYCLRIGAFPSGAADEACFDLVVTGPPQARVPSQAPAAWAVTDVAWGPEATGLALADGALAGGVAVSPNPFRSRATLRFTLEEAGPIRLAVYDALGREVAVLAEGPAEAGVHAAALDGSGLASGVYVWRLVAGGGVQTGRLTLVR